MGLLYTIVLTIVDLATVYFGLLESTEWLYQQHFIGQHSAVELFDKGDSSTH